MGCLALNASFEPLTIVPARRAVRLDARHERSEDAIRKRQRFIESITSPDTPPEKQKEVKTVLDLIKEPLR